MNIKLKHLAIGTGLALATLSSTAMAFPFYSPTTTFEDDNAEFVIDANNDGILNAGDKLRAVVEWPQITNVFGPGSLNLNANGLEVTGISEIEVVSVSAAGNYVFGPSATFTSVYGANAMVALYLDDTGIVGPNGDLDVFSCANVAACELAATNGNIPPAGTWLTAGINPLDPADYWTSKSETGAPTVIANLALTPAASKVGVANFGLSILTNSTGVQFADQFNPLSPGGDKKNQIIGSGDVLGGQGLSNGYQARSDFDFQVTVVPEPATLSLFGAGLIALGMRRRLAVK